MNASTQAAEGQFDNAETQRQSSLLGMWIFLATELMFFGPLFLSYAVGRTQASAAFAAASRHTDVIIGSANTGILLTSSLFMALAVRAMQLHRRHAAIRSLVVAAILGTLFLGLKGLEYYHEWQEHLIPWSNFQFDANQAQAAGYFFFLYFGMTGLHAVHLTIGVCIVLALALRLRNTKGERLNTTVEVTALYWHFVDAVWVFLYPLIYLVERHT